MITVRSARPRIVVVTGLPCSGKSKLAARLNESWRVPLLCKDTFKESLFESLGTGDREWSRRLSAAAYDLLFQQAGALLALDVPCILEGNFRPRQHDESFARLRAAGARFVQVFCHARAEVLIDRFRERAESGARHAGHVDRDVLSEISAEIAGTEQCPLDIGGRTVVCDT